MSNDEGRRVTRRGMLRSSAAAAGVAAATGTAAAAEEDGGGEGGSTQPDFGGWLAGIDGGYQDMRGESSVTIEVGAEGNGGPYAFSPAGIWIDSGTTVTFEWVSDNHNVVVDSGSWGGYETIENGGFSTEHTFESGGITKYFCAPHKSQGMQGAIAVGEDVPTVTITEDTSLVPDAAKAMGVAGAAALAGTLGLTYAFVKYGGTRSDE
jgi:halocyanin-like protein